jgi:hypothetical protein
MAGYPPTVRFFRSPAAPGAVDHSSFDHSRAKNPAAASDG